MRKIGLALVAVTTVLAFAAPMAADAAVTCKIIASWCPADGGGDKGDHHPNNSVPEPASLLLLGAGVSAVGAAVARRRKNKKD